MAVPLQAKLGQTLDGRFLLTEEIGRGGMAVVYKARQVALNRSVALKMILASHLAAGEVPAWSADHARSSLLHSCSRLVPSSPVRRPLTGPCL